MQIKAEKSKFWNIPFNFNRDAFTFLRWLPHDHHGNKISKLKREHVWGKWRSRWLSSKCKQGKPAADGFAADWLHLESLWRWSVVSLARPDVLPRGSHRSGSTVTDWGSQFPPVINPPGPQEPQAHLAGPNRRKGRQLIHWRNQGEFWHVSTQINTQLPAGIILSGPLSVLI